MNGATRGIEWGVIIMAFDGDIRCPPYPIPAPLRGDESTLELAAHASRVADYWRALMDARVNYAVTMRAAGMMARAIDALTTSVCDDVT